MKPNDQLKIHFINVNHGDAIIVEMPDYDGYAHFGIIDLGPPRGEEKLFVTEYMKKLIQLRRNNANILNYKIDFVCITHPHDDHYGGITKFINEFGDSQNTKIEEFWDCGFRVNDTTYNNVLKSIKYNDKIRFKRVSAGSEFEFGDVRIQILSPSVDLRNRFDTWGVDINDSSIVLRIQLKKAFVILAGDAEFASWGKITEEFPRRESITFFRDSIGLAEWEDPAKDQLKCLLLKVSHHGSKRGTNFEYLERLNPNHIVITAGSQQWYQNNKPTNWQNKFPDQLIKDILKILKSSLLNPNKYSVTGNDGNVIYKFRGTTVARDVKKFTTKPTATNFLSVLRTNWQ